MGCAKEGGGRRTSAWKGTGLLAHSQGKLSYPKAARPLYVSHALQNQRHTSGHIAKGNANPGDSAALAIPERARHKLQPRADKKRTKPPQQESANGGEARSPSNRADELQLSPLLHSHVPTLLPARAGRPPPEYRHGRAEEQLPAPASMVA